MRVSARARVALAVLAVLVVALAGGCARQVSGTASAAGAAAGPSPAPSRAVSTSPLLESVPFVSSRRGFALQPPVGWRSDTSGKLNAEVIFTNPRTDPIASGTFAANIYVLARPTTQRLEAVVDEIKSDINRQIPTLEVSTDEAATTVSGLRAHLFGGTYTDVAQLPEPVRDLRLIVVDGNTAYIVTGTSLASTYDQHEPAIRASLLSFASRR